jgi:hypothetical protein
MRLSRSNYDYHRPGKRIASMVEADCYFNALRHAMAHLACLARQLLREGRRTMIRILNAALLGAPINHVVLSGPPSCEPKVKRRSYE